MSGASNGVATLQGQLEQATRLLEEGQMQSAVQLCQGILSQDETCAPAYSIMGDILRRMGNYASAEKFLDLALRFDDANPGYRIQKAQTLYSLGQVAPAIKELETVLRRFPNHAIAHLLMGDFLINLKKYDQAHACFATVRMLEDMPGLDEHVGLCYMEEGKLKEAAQCFLNVIERMPTYFRPYVMLGQIRLDQKDEASAEAYFNKALELTPNAYQAWSGKGAIENARKNYAAASQYFQNAIQSNPGNHHAWYVMGAFLQEQKQMPDAEQFLRRAVELNPSYLLSQVALANNLFNMGKRTEALSHIEAVLAQDPENVAFKHMRAGIVGETPENAPAEYVSNLFDGYAETFDIHLVSGLGYKTPTVIAETLEQVMQQVGDARHDLSLLDLGCGTGLGAEALKGITSWRAGVDLSEKMIDKAREKQLYDALEVAEVVSYLQHSTRHYDLIAACDVLVYIGNLEPLFAASADKLSPQGYLVLSIENGDAFAPFALRPSGRYVHAASYLESLAAQHGLKVLRKDLATIRTENYEPVEGYIFIFQK